MASGGGDEEVNVVLSDVEVLPMARTSQSFGREEVRVGAGDLGSPASFWRLRRPDLRNGGIVDLRFD